MDTGGGPWALRALTALADCDPITVVVGAQADAVAALLPAGVRVERNDDFDLGMGSSLRRGLLGLAARPEDDDVHAAVVMLVDLPDVGVAVVRRIVATATGPIRQALVRAAYGGRPGHPVLLGRDHWPGVLATATGDQGARGYLVAHGATLVECGDLATATDVERPGASS